MDLVQTWYDDRYCWTLHFHTGLDDFDHDSIHLNCLNMYQTKLHPNQMKSVWKNEAIRFCIALTMWTPITSLVDTKKKKKKLKSVSAISVVETFATQDGPPRQPTTQTNMTNYIDPYVTQCHMDWKGTSTYLFSNSTVASVAVILLINACKRKQILSYWRQNYNDYTIWHSL